MRPAHIDRQTGYRYYTIRQLPRLNSILAQKRRSTDEWIAGPPFEQNLNGTRSETEHAKLLLADPVGQVHRLRLAEIGDRLGAAAQRFIGEAAVVVGLDIGRIELDRLREICNGVVAVTLCDVGFAARVERVEVLGVYRDRLIIVPDRVIDLAQLLIGIAAIPYATAFFGLMLID